MSVWIIFLIAFSLAMDAFAVALSKGLVVKEDNYKKGLIIGLYFGLFQGIMPLFGYYLGIFFKDVVVNVDHWIAFILLAIIGSNMIRESISSEENAGSDSVNFKNMFFLSIATSIDALTIGITFAFLNVNIYFSSLLICLITFILSFIGVIIGNKFNEKFDKKAELVGGIILILMGLKILLEHLFI